MPLDSTPTKHLPMNPEAQRIIRLADERNEFVTDVDGFVYWWPNRDHGGHFAPYMLRALADELDRRNEAWNQQINDYFNSPDREPTRTSE